MRHPPGPRGREVLQFFGRGSIDGTLTFLEGTARCYGPISSFRLLHKRFYLVDQPELIKEILVTRQHEFVRDSGATLLRELVGDGMITREEPSHRERRRVLQPAFHRDQIARYAEMMVIQSERIAAEWAEKDVLDVRREMRRLTLSIVGSTLFGTDFGGSADRIAGVLERVVKKSRWLGPAFTLIEPLALAYRRLAPRGPSLFFQPERAELQNIVAPIIEQRRQAGTRDILSLILSEENGVDAPLSNEDVRNEVVTFVLAGHETTSAALTWTWYLLSQYPEVSIRLRDELERVLNGRPPGLADVPNLTYTANVFKEAMRLYPPAVLFARRPKHDIELGGYTIKASESIFLSPFITQRNPQYFERPERFEPERWDGVSPPKFAYFPFGGGAKMCIGESFARLEGVLALATLARRWNLVREDKTPVDFGAGFVLNADRPMLMKPVASAAAKRGLVDSLQ